ncbi:uncharacterized protein LOC144175130 isoform X2 [Haemaphysalis longicornis]
MHTGMDRAEHNDRSERPLAVILTGAPGSYSHFSYTIPFLDRHGVDVLCVQWPDYQFTLQTGYWWHTSDEKTCLLVDLFKKLGVKTIDLLVSHSSGALPAMQLTAEVSEVQVNSMALLMPCTGNDISAVRRTSWINAYGDWLLKVPGTFRVTALWFQVAMIISRNPAKRRMDDVFFGYFSVAGVDNHRYCQQVASVLERRLPMMVMIGATDKLISVEDNQRFLLRLGCDPLKTWRYGEDGQLVSKGESDVVKVIELLKGSHYGFNRHSDICNNALLELLSRVSPVDKPFHD